MYPSQQNATDQTANFFWVLVMIIGSVLVVWWLFREVIVVPVYLFRYYEIDLIKYVYDVLSPIANFLHLPAPNLHNLNILQQHILHTNSHTEPMTDFAKVNGYVGNIVRYPVAVVLSLMAVYVYFRHSSSRFRQAHSMKSLRAQEAENWPQIKPVLSTDLIKEDIEKGPWAMAKVPLAFCKERDMLVVGEDSQGRKEWSISRGKAYRTFALQLGPLWNGVHALPIHVKALLVVFAARSEHERDVAKKVLTQIAASAASGQLDFTGIEDLVKRYENSRAVKWLENRHAYVTTLMASLLEIARSDGVLATAEFLWLKPVDRRLWYVLNGVGRQTAVVEVAGPFAHWLAERKLQRALKAPMVKEAVNGLEVAVKDTLYIEKGDKWHTSNAA